MGHVNNRWVRLSTFYLACFPYGKRSTYCKTVFDPCIGWGGRMIGTTCLGEDYHYTGCEPFTKTFSGLENIVRDLDISDNVTLYNRGVETVLEVCVLKLYLKTRLQNNSCIACVVL